jgi:ABC-type phosphonate transport system ATPase subunit
MNGSRAAHVDAAALLLSGQVMHQRLRPVRHRFVYPVFCVRLDLARMAEAGNTWFGVDRRRLMCVRTRDYGPRDGSDLGTWVRGHLQQAGLPHDGTIWLQTFPRLGERIGNLGSQLSGGEQQMLSIGRALMTHPTLIILDEATEGLAPLIVAEIWRVIGEIRTSGIATLIVDRDYRKVLAQADRALVLQKGQVVLQGSAATLRDDPQLAGCLGV